VIPPMPYVIEAIEQVESKGNWYVVSKSGCIGVMQVCPKWSKVKKSELLIPEINRREGERLFTSWLKASHGNVARALAAYRYGYDGLHGKKGSDYAYAVLRIAKSKWILAKKEEES